MSLATQRRTPWRGIVIPLSSPCASHCGAGGTRVPVRDGSESAAVQTVVAAAIRFDQGAPLLLGFEHVGHLQALRARRRQDRLAALPRLATARSLMQRTDNLRLDRAKAELVPAATHLVIVRCALNMGSCGPVSAPENPVSASKRSRSSRLNSKSSIMRGTPSRSPQIEA